jgi:predicted nucleotidyltransferase
MTAPPRLNFARLISTVTQRPTEVEKAEGRRDAIRTRLIKSFNVAGISTIGSYSRGTAIANHSDVDLLANLRRKEAKWGGSWVSSSTLLQRVRDDLTDRFVTSAVRRDGQAVVVSFAQGRVDVVPALFVRMQDAKPVYQIPDGGGEWLETSPQAHLVWLRKQQLRSTGKMNNVVRLLKYWKYCRTTTQTLSSFYLEMWLANSGICVGAKSYSEILATVFFELNRQSLNRISDPVGVSGWIHGTETSAQLGSVQTAVGSCAEHAAAAIAAEVRAKNEEANRQWNLVFNGYF